MRITKYFTPIFIFLTTFFVLVPIISAQTIEEAEKKYQITYPIAELENCADLASCRSYCDDLTHKDVCVAFAKKKGFYKENAMAQKKAEILAASKTELGCDSPESCKQKCEEENNFEKCSEFAKKFNLNGGNMLSDKNQQLLTKAKDILGCDSPTTCKTICEKEENREKCSEFAKQTGLRGGKKMEGPGGCNSKETCEAYCSDPNHFDECKKFGPGPDGQGKPGGPQGGFKGPGGCDSKETCEKYCQEHEDECRKIGGGPKDKKPENIEKLCEGNPEKCKEMRQEFIENKQENREEFCKNNPDKCKEAFGQPGNIRPNDLEFCKNNPDKCKERMGNPEEFKPNDNNKPPEDFCKQNPEKCRKPAESDQKKSREEYCKEHPQECENRQQDNNRQKPPPPSPNNTEVKGVSSVYNSIIYSFVKMLLGY